MYVNAENGSFTTFNESHIKQTTKMFMWQYWTQSTKKVLCSDVLLYLQIILVTNNVVIIKK